MSAAFDAVSSTTGSGVTSVSWTHTPVGTPTAVGMGTYYFGDALVTAATYGLTSFGASVANSSDTTGDLLRLYGLANPASGAQTVSITWQWAVYPVAGSVTVTSSDTTTCYRSGSPNSANGSGNALSVTISSATGDLIYAVGGQDPCGTITPGNTSRWTQASGGLDGMGETADGAASVAMTASTSGSNPWCIAGASFQAAAAAGIAVPVLTAQYRQRWQ